MPRVEGITQVFLIKPCPTCWNHRKLPELTAQKDVHLHFIFRQPKCFYICQHRASFLSTPSDTSTDSAFAKLRGSFFFFFTFWSQTHGSLILLYAISYLCPLNNETELKLSATPLAIAAVQCPWLCAAPKGSWGWRVQTPRWTPTISHFPYTTNDAESHTVYERRIFFF